MTVTSTWDVAVAPVAFWQVAMKIVSLVKVTECEPERRFPQGCVAGVPPGTCAVIPQSAAFCEAHAICTADPAVTFRAPEAPFAVMVTVGGKALTATSTCEDAVAPPALWQVAVKIVSLETASE